MSLLSDFSRRVRALSLFLRTGMLWLLAVAIVGVTVLQISALPANQQAHETRGARLLQGLDRPKFKYVPGEVLVRFRATASEQSRQAAHAAVSAEVMTRFESVSRLERVRLPEGLVVEEAVAKYRAHPEVLYAEPNYIVHALNVPNDPQFPQQWNLHNTGQSGGTPGADIHAPEAWNTTTGSASVVVAVIDSGVDYTHPDLAAQIWSAPVPFTANLLNGNVVNCPAGSKGFNAVDGTCDPRDDNAHGTHVSGILGAIGNNGIGVAGVNWTIQILSCKFLNTSGAGDLGGALACLDLVRSLKNSGINIVATNNSWGGSGFSQALADTIAAQQQSGILFIAAAGNEFLDNDLAPTYPASFYLPNVISVAATTRRDEFDTFSNTGHRTVHLGAPGDEILSTTPNNTYSVFSGTSMAAPHVTGLAALLRAQDPSRDWRAIKNLLLAGGDIVPALSESITGRRLNAAGALNCVNQTVSSRLLPVADTISGVPGRPVTLAALNIRCDQGSGPVTATVLPGGQVVALVDDGTGADQAAGDGIYTGQWTPTSNGSFALTFPWGDAVRVEVLQSYIFQPASSSYVTIAGTNLNLGDDSVIQIASPFTISYGGGSFTQLFVGSNGTVSFTDAFSDFLTSTLPPPNVPPLAIPQPLTLVAPWWQDLFPVKSTTQNVFWDVVGVAPNRQLVLEWRDVRSFRCNADPNATIKFQIVFFEGKSDVQFNYADTSFGGNCSGEDHGGAATVGLQEALGTAQMYSFRSQAIGDGTSILWTIPATPPAVNPAPTLSSISPASAVAGGPGITVTVNGTNFVPGSRVQFNGNDRVTTFVGSTQLTAQLGPADLNPIFAGTADVTVFTPAPGGGTSQKATFMLLNPVPTITSLTPSSAVAGGLSLALTVKGSSLRFGASAIYWNGQPLPISGATGPDTMNGAVPFGLIANPGTAQVTVVTGPPGGGTSNALTFTINPAQAAAPTNAAQASPQRVEVDGLGQVQGPPGIRLPQPARFLGWNHARTMGPAYLKHFARPHADLAIPVASPVTPTGRSSSAAQARTAGAALSTPGSLPGFALRNPLPADFLPTSVATGDFNRDGKLDWVVANGGSNTLWIYLGKGDGTSQVPVVILLKGQAPIQVIAADLRKTGILDLVVAEADTRMVGVLLGNGDGTFQPEVTFDAPGPVITVAAGDFDGDGKIDVVAGLIGDEVTGPVAFLRGNGTGHFGSPVTRPTQDFSGSYATFSLQALDFNRDGLPDLLMTDLGGVVPGVHVYVSEGNGTFKHSQYVAGDGPFITFLNAVGGDLDEDGCPDIAGSTDAGLVYVFHGNCDGSFAGFPNAFFVGAGDDGAGLGLADMNGDGHLDVVTSGITLGVGGFGPETGNTVAVLVGDGRGHLSPGKIYRGNSGMFSLAIGDLNGDGRPDVITANQDSDSVSVYLNDRQGGLGDPTGAYVGYSTNGSSGGAINTPVRGPVVTDVNGDGKPDVVFLEVGEFYPLAWQLAVLLNDGTGHFGPPIRSDAMEGTFQIYDLKLADFRGTGSPDLLVLGTDINSSTTYLGFAPNAGGGKFGRLKLVNVGGTPGILAFGDFNGDGKLDIAVARGSGRLDLIDRISVLFGKGDGTFQPGPNTDFGTASTTGGFPRLAFVGDFNQDKKLDLIVSVNDNVIGPGSLPHPVFEFLGNGDGTFQPPIPILPEATYLSMADVNHDGLVDLIELVQPITIQGFNRPIYKIHLGRPDGSFQDGATYQPFAGLIGALPSPGPSALGFPGPLLGDFNGDGNVDIAVPQRFPGFDANTGGPLFARGYIQVLLGNGDGTFTPDYAVFELNKLSCPNLAADVNGDGRDDLIEVDPWPSSFNVIPASMGPSLQARLVSNPVIGNTGTLRLTLSLTAASATTLTLSASDPNIGLPVGVTIPAGGFTQDVQFTIGTGFDRSHVFALYAQLGTETAVAYGTQAMVGQTVGFQLFLLHNQQAGPPGGATDDYGVSVLSVNGYATSVQLQCQGLPVGSSCAFGSASVDLLPGTFVNVSVRVQVAPGTPLGFYPFTIVATDGSVTRQITATLGVSDFNLTITPSSKNTVPSQGVHYTLIMNSLFGWSQSVNTTCPVAPPGPKCSLDGSFIAPGQIDLFVDPRSAGAGNYTITVTGSGLGVTHSATAQLIVQDFTAALSASAATIPVGSSSNFNLTLSSVNGFTDQLTFACLNAPAGVSCSFNPSSAPLPANGTLVTVLTVKVTSRPVTQVGATAGFKLTPNAILAQRFVGGLLVLILALALRARQPQRRWIPGWGFALGALVLWLASASAGCGGGGGGGSSNPPPPPATVTLVIQASSPSQTKNIGNVTITVP